MKQWQHGFIKLSRGVLILYVTIFLIFAGFIFYFFFFQKTEILGSMSNTKTLTHEEALSDPTLIEVNKLVELPKGEKVTYGEIKNKETLEKYQAYFKKASIGQLLIILPKMTIIYDPQTKTIVDIANVKLY